VKIQFSGRRWEEYLYWQQTDQKILRKINDLIKEISRNPYDGIGKPEMLKHAYAGYWSRRITDEHRLVYKIEDKILVIVQVRYHYE